MDDRIPYDVYFFSLRINIGIKKSPAVLATELFLLNVFQYLTSVRDKSLLRSVPLSPTGSLWEKGAMGDEKSLIQSLKMNI